MSTLIVSPHFDDAPLSLGQTMLDGAIGRGPVTVGVVFSRSNWTVKAYPTRARWPLVSAARYGEELVNGRRFGYRVRRGGVEEAILRTGETHVSSFRRPEPVLDEHLVERVMHVVQGWVTDRTTAVFAPLGLGDHIDHLITAEASRRLDDPRVRFYEDRPYTSELDDEAIAAHVRRFDPTLRQSAGVAITPTKHDRLWYPTQFDDYFATARQVDIDQGRSERIWQRA